MIITKIQLAAMERVRITEEERVDFYLYVDEFQNFATDSFAGILSEARKYRLGLILAAESALTNGPIKAMFKRVRPSDGPGTKDDPGEQDGPLPYGLRRPVTSSFPSGHAAGAFAVAPVLARHFGPRVAVQLSPRDGTDEALLARLLELRVLQRNPAVSATDATSIARALALRLGLARAPVDAATELAVIGANHGDPSGSDGRFLAWLDERLAPEAGTLLGATLSKAWRGDDGSRWRTAGDPWFVLLRNFSGESESGPKLDELVLGQPGLLSQ
jgi:membrane-associated phospholipid phosphatase